MPCRLCGDFVRGLQDGDEVPRQQSVDPIDRVLCDLREHVAQVGFGVDVVELGGADERVDRRCPLAAAVGTDKEKRVPLIAATSFSRDRTTALRRFMLWAHHIMQRSASHVGLTSRASIPLTRGSSG